MNQRLKDTFKHRFRTLKHFIIPESNHAKSQASKNARTLEVLDQSIRVLPAIELDDQPRPDADEIRYEPTDRDLPPESISAQPAVSQVMPETPFGVA